MQFKNPVNGYVENASAPIVWAFIFGPLYFMFKGAWGHAAIYMVAALATSGLAWFVYPWFGRVIVRNAYLRAGWSVVDPQREMAITRAYNMGARELA